MRTVLVATDGSEHASRAIERGIEMAAAHDATIHVLCVVDRRLMQETAFSTEELATIIAEDHGHDRIDAVRAQADEAGVDVVTVLRHGIPEEEILEYADEVDADVILIGDEGDHVDHCGGVGRAVAERSSRQVHVVPGGPETGAIGGN
jgi:nucleotide-binding universal stress UspA family protein